MRISDWSSDVCSSDLHDRPGQAGEGALKKGCGQPEDAVRWFDPRREALAPRFLAEPPETHEGVHLVDVATDGLVGPPQPVDLRVGRAREQVPVARRAPDDPVEPRRNFGVAVTNHALGDLDQ